MSDDRWRWGALCYACLFVAASLLLNHKVKRSSRSGRYPPGPKGTPFLGYTLLIPSKKPWEAFRNFGKPYGPIYRLTVAGKSLIVVNSFNTANDLFNKRSGTFSDRPSRVMGFICKYHLGLTFLPLGDRFRETRKHLYTSLNMKAAQSFHGLQEKEVHAFLRRLLSHTSELDKGIRRLFSSTMLQFCIGYRIESDDDPMMSLSERVAKNAGLILTAGKYWIEFFPVLKFLPVWMMGSNIQGAVPKFRSEIERLIEVADAHVRSCLSEGDQSPSFVSNILENAPRDDLKDASEMAHYASVSVYGGAVDTTISAVRSFFLAMILYPDVQRRAQAEIDSVLGTGRLPKHSDRASLPYVNAIVGEVLRWNPPIPLTSRHLKHDEEYDGYILPTGSNVVANMWAMTHDENVYPDPHWFCPDRFLIGSPEDNEKKIRELYKIMFGFGRRTCPGMHFADASVWITICTVLTVLNISPALGPDGKEVAPKVDCHEGAIFSLAPYECRIQPRSVDAANLINSTASV